MSKIKKVAIIVPEFTEKKILNVPWKQIFEIAKRLNKKNIKTVIFTEKECIKKIENTEIIKLNEKTIRVLSNESIQQINSLKPDLIYWIGNTFSGLYMQKNQFRVPIIMHISSVDWINKEIFNFSIKELILNHKLWLITSFYPMYNIVSKLNHRNITAIISSSQTISNRLKRLGVNKKIYTSPLFFESNFKVENTLEPDNVFTLCYAGPVNTIRGTDLVLKTVKSLVEKGKNVRLKFLLRTYEKEIDERKILAIIKKYKIEKNVNVYSGILPPEKIRDYFCKSHVIILPTKFVWNEPPVTILEAMSLGKTVITTNVCGLPEMLNNNAILVKPSEKNIVEKILELMENNEKITEFENKAKKYVDSLQGWDEMTEWTLQVFENILKNKKSTTNN